MSKKVSLMRSSILIGVGVFALSCGSSSSPGGSSIPREQACAQGAQSSCAKVFSCAPSDPVIAIVQASLGGSTAACVTMIQQKNCSVFECATAADYHGDRAAQCKVEFSAVSCQDLSSAAVAALAGGVPAFLSSTSFPGCAATCTGGPADAGSGN